MTATITVGSSDVAAILGLSPWSTPGETWAKLTGLVERYGGGTASTLRGQIMEPAILAYWGEQHGCTVVPGPPTPAPPIIGAVPWMHARPDGIAALPDGSQCIVEIKTTRGWDGWGDPAEGGAPPIYYLMQVVWQMAVCQIEHTSLMAYCPMDDGLRTYEIGRDMAVEDRLVARVREWMAAYVWGDPSPPPDTPSRLLYPTVRGEQIDATDEALAIAAELAAVRSDISALTGRKDALANRIQALIGDTEGMRGVATWRASKGRTTVDTKRLKTDYPDAYAACKKTGDARRTFRFTYRPKDLK